MQRISRRDAVAAIVVALVAALLAASPLLDPLRGLSIDTLTALRWRTLGARHDPASSPTVVIALDEATYRTPPFRGSPTVAWTREIGRVVDATVAGGARVVGFDIVLPTSIEESAIPFDDGTLGAHLRGFDRDFLRALALPARDGKIVLGEVQHGAEPVVPAAGQRIAVGGARNIRLLNVYSDPDGVVRRVPLTFAVDGRPVPGMAVEMAARALGVTPEIAADRGLTLGSYRVPTTIANTMTINFAGGSNDIPTFSLADLRACLDKGDSDFFRRHFAGKVVLIGSVLDFEDRRLTAKRFATAPAAPAAERCALPPLPPAPFARDTVDGVYVQAAAINDLLRGDAVVELGRLPAGLIAAAFAALAALAALAFAPAIAAAGCATLALAWTAAATLAFDRALALPLVEPFAAGLAALVAMTGFRLIVTDREKRLLRRSFALYLAPAVIEQMMASSRLPQLGGETRSVTVFFSDVAGFSAFSEVMRPADIVALMNRYLAAMTDVIEAHGGFVDKYMGDAIVAVFGAPIEAAHQAADAVHAALRCCERLAELNRDAAATGGRMLVHRIGLNSGEALLGNIGSRRRFNYTVVGDTVNLASRIEGANEHFATAVLASEATMRLAGAGFVWREIDAVRVKGRTQPVTLYEPLAAAGRATAEQMARAEAYTAGLAAWRHRDFSAAAGQFARIADADPPAARFLARARKFALDPPGEDWSPIETLEAK